MTQRSRITLAASLLGLLLSTPAFARQSAQGWCQAGGRTVTTSGLTSTTLVQQSAPSCTVTVNIVGGGLATIFADNSGTALGNPFAAAANGQWQWYADNGHYSVVTSGGTPTLPSSVTYPDILLDDTAGTGFTYQAVSFSATPTFNIGSASYFVMSLTGNVTSSSVSGSPVGGSLIGFQLCQDSTGSRTFAWPGNFARPPTISPIASSCTQASFVFDSVSATWRVFAPPGDAFTSVLPTTCGANSFLNTIAEQGGTCAQPSAANLSNGVTGSGAVVLATSPAITTPTITSPTLITPVLGAATGTSLSLSSTLGVTGTSTLGAVTTTGLTDSGNASVTGTLGVTGTSTLGTANTGAITATAAAPLSLLSGSTNNMTMNLGRAATEANIAVPQANGFFFTNSDLAAGDFVVRQITSGRKIYLGTGASGASLAVTNTGLNFYTATGTLPASISNDVTGGLNFVTNGGTGWTLVNDGRLFSGPGKALVLQGSISGNTSLIATSVAGSTSITVPAINDQMVTRTSTDNMVNKNLTGASTANNIQMLNAQGAVGPQTGNGADQVLYTYSLPANTLDTTSKSVVIRCGLTHTSGTVSTSLKLNINGVNVLTGLSGTTASQSISLEAEILRTGTTTGGSWGFIPNAAGTMAPFTQGLTGLAWTSIQTITCTEAVAASDTWSGVMFTVKQIQ